MSRRVSESVLRVNLADKTSKKAIDFATGFVFYQDGAKSYILTCAHLFESLTKDAEITVDDRHASVVHSGEAIGVDLAVLEVEGALNRQPLVLDPSAAHEGNSVVAIGFQEHGGKDVFLIRELEGHLGAEVGLESRSDLGRIKAWDLYIDDPYHQLAHGLSGSPVIDRTSHRVVAVLRDRDPHNHSKGLALSVEALYVVSSHLAEMSVASSSQRQFRGGNTTPSVELLVLEDRHALAEVKIAPTGLTQRTETPPEDLQLPEGYYYLGTNDSGNVHNLYRVRDGHVAVLIKANNSILNLLMIDKYQITAAQFCQFINESIQAKTLIFERDSNKNIKMVRHISGSPVVYDALDLWHGRARSDYEWRFSAPPWGITYQDGQWLPVSGCARLPITNVTWLGAKLYGLWAHDQTVMSISNSFVHLASEKQWQAAACWDPTSGQFQRFPWGENWKRQSLNYAGYWSNAEVGSYEVDWVMKWATVPSVYSQTRPQEVGAFESGVSPVGCVQMLGNVWEWCADELYERGHSMSPLKGGACFSPKDHCMPDFRYHFARSVSSEYVGFRCSRSVTRT